LAVEPVQADDAENAARLWRRGAGLSLADRLCLATAERLDAMVWTADTAWGSNGRVRQIR
jgi:ribonuclease VapC